MNDRNSIYSPRLLGKKRIVPGPPDEYSGTKGGDFLHTFPSSTFVDRLPKLPTIPGLSLSGRSRPSTRPIPLSILDPSRVNVCWGAHSPRSKYARSVADAGGCNDYLQLASRSRRKAFPSRTIVLRDDGMQPLGESHLLFTSAKLPSPPSRPPAVTPRLLRVFEEGADLGSTIQQISTQSPSCNATVTSMNSRGSSRHPVPSPRYDQIRSYYSQRRVEDEEAAEFKRLCDDFDVEMNSKQAAIAEISMFELQSPS